MASFSGFDEQTLERFADLMVGFGANVQKGQIVAIGAEIGKEEVARALAASARIRSPYQEGTNSRVCGSALARRACLTCGS